MYILERILHKKRLIKNILLKREKKRKKNHSAQQMKKFKKIDCFTHEKQNLNPENGARE